MLKPILLIVLLLPACGGAVQGCPLNTPATALTCKQAVAEGRMTKDECYQKIEESCP